MSTSSAPITPVTAFQYACFFFNRANISSQEAFLRAIRQLELEQLYAEAARLQNSIYHLNRSIIALEEFESDPDCKEAINDNRDTIQRQTERVEMIVAEVARRGFPTEHIIPGKVVNGVDQEEEVVVVDAQMVEGPPPGAGQVETAPRGDTSSQEDERGEGGLYL